MRVQLHHQCPYTTLLPLVSVSLLLAPYGYADHGGDSQTGAGAGHGEWLCFSVINAAVRILVPADVCLSHHVRMLVEERAQTVHTEALAWRCTPSLHASWRPQSTCICTTHAHAAKAKAHRIVCPSTPAGPPTVRDCDCGGHGDGRRGSKRGQARGHGSWVEWGCRMCRLSVVSVVFWRPHPPSGSSLGWCLSCCCSSEWVGGGTRRVSRAGAIWLLAVGAVGAHALGNGKDDLPAAVRFKMVI
jgi:hypothetical protein